MPKAVVDQFEALLREHEVVAKPTAAAELQMRDPDDRWLVASDTSASADVLVTGDQDLLTVRHDSPVPITDPRGFWELLRRGA